MYVGTLNSLPLFKLSTYFRMLGSLCSGCLQWCKTIWLDMFAWNLIFGCMTEFLVKSINPSSFKLFAGAWITMHWPFSRWISEQHVVCDVGECRWLEKFLLWEVWLLSTRTIINETSNDSDPVQVPRNFTECRLDAGENERSSKHSSLCHCYISVIFFVICSFSVPKYSIWISDVVIFVKRGISWITQNLLDFSDAASDNFIFMLCLVFFFCSMTSQISVFYAVFWFFSIRLILLS